MCLVSGICAALYGRTLSGKGDKVTVSLHHTALFILESLILFDPLFLLIRIVSSVILTTALILTVEALNFESSRSGE